MKKIFFFLLFLFFLPGLNKTAHASEEPLTDSAQESLLDSIDLQEIEDTLRELSAVESFSFRDAVASFLKGETPFTLEEIGLLCRKLLFSELSRQKQLAFQVILLVIASAVFSNFVKIFENSQIADIGFYMIYLLISTLLLQAFVSMNEIVGEAFSALLSFMKVLLPSYLLTIVFSSGTVAALGFYEATLFGMFLLETAMMKIMIPAVNYYLVLLILNQLSKEDYFSKLAELLELLISWGIKTVMGVVIGLQTVQCLIAPAVDSMQNSVLHRLAKSIPGIGNAFDAVSETVTGSAVILKNAVGVAGMLAVLAICLLPVLKLLVSVLLFRFLCAVIQPVCEKRMVECIGSISRGSYLLMKILLSRVAVFLISLAMITAALKG